MTTTYSFADLATNPKDEVRFYIGDTGTVTNAMLAGSIATSKLTNGSYLPTGTWPTTTTNGDFLNFNGTTGAPQDSTYGPTSFVTPTTLNNDSLPGSLTKLALGGATLGTNLLAVAGTSSFAGNVSLTSSSYFFSGNNFGAATGTVIVGSNPAGNPATVLYLQGTTINLYTGPSGIEGFQFATNQLGVLKNGVVGFTNLTTGSTGAIQTAIGQDSSYDADVLYVGNGTQGDHSATVRFATLQADTQITVDGATAEGAGTINALTGYYADNMQGLTCSGTPTSSFATVGGIVIHC